MCHVSYFIHLLGYPSAFSAKRDKVMEGQIILSVFFARFNCMLCVQYIESYGSNSHMICAVS